MKIILELNTNDPGDRELMATLGMDALSGDTGTDTVAAAEPAKRGPGRPAKVAPAATTVTQNAASSAGQAPAAAAAAAAAPAAANGADDTALIPEIKTAMTQLAELTSPQEAAKYLRTELGFPTVPAIPSEKRQTVLDGFREKINSAITG